ncbi:MAG: hypothetical protein K9G26_00535 [Emcibacter sp.]|nr:hypothetical protein [Emcibacter sp.]
MTNYILKYGFMDLLKDKKIAPRTDMNTIELAAIINEMVSKLSMKVEQQTEDYNFMDLLHDKGFVPEPSNDNDARKARVA